CFFLAMGRRRDSGRRHVAWFLTQGPPCPFARFVKAAGEEMRQPEVEGAQPSPGASAGWHCPLTRKISEQSAEHPCRRQVRVQLKRPIDEDQTAIALASEKE